jgi:hypothetical protein
MLFLAAPCVAQNPPQPTPTQQSALERLYAELGSAGLDAAQVYKIRGVALDRPGVHLTFTDGMVAFTRTVQGRVTGMFFEGEGDILLLPPTRMERSAMGLFTGTPTLNEGFTTAYLRFNDQTAQELQPQLRAVAPDDAQDAKDFLDRWTGVAASLDESDRLRLLLSFAGDGDAARDRFLHARLAGSRLGTFDLYYDSLAAEQVKVVQARSNERGGVFLDVWTSFSPGLQPHAATTAAENVPTPQDNAPPGFLRTSDYKIRANVQPPTHLDATTEVTVEARERPVRLMLLELSRYLHVTAVSRIAPGGEQTLEFIREETQRGTKAERGGNDVIAVLLPTALQPGESARLRFQYGGDVLFDAGGGLLLVGARGTWFPNRGLLPAKFDLEFTYPADWTLVATGDLQQSTKNGNLQVSRWTTPEPRPTAGFNLGQYLQSSVNADGVQVSAFITRAFAVKTNPAPPRAPDVIPGRTPRPAIAPTPPLPASARAENVAKAAAHAVEWMAERIGPFPYHELRVTETPLTSSQGWPGLVFLSTLAYLTPDERTRATGNDQFLNVLYGRLTVPHEIGHQWWGDAVGWATYHDEWFAEATANYLALMMLEQQNPAEFRMAMQHFRDELVKEKNNEPATDAGPVTLGDRLDSSRFPNGYGTVAYGRGSWLLHMLREMLREPQANSKTSGGDELFFSVLKNLQTKFQGKRLTTADVQRAFEAVLPEGIRFESKRSLDWFFEGWVNGAAVPRLELTDVKFTTRGTKTLASGSIVQKDAPEDLVTPAPIYAVDASGRTVFAGWVFADGDETSFQLEAPAGTRKLLLDPNFAVLRQ